MTTPTVISIGLLVRQARELKSDSGENPEYDRALVELVMRASGLTTDDREQVARDIGIVQPEPPTEFFFRAAAQVGFTTDPEGHVIGVSIDVLDAVDPPRDEEGDLEAPLEVYEAVYERAEALGWALPEPSLAEPGAVPPWMDFGGAF
jgi:hypothetical protein